MKLLKAPDPNEPWVALHWVEYHKWHWIYFNSDGTASHNIGPIEKERILIEVKKPDDDENMGH